MAGKLFQGAASVLAKVLSPYNISIPIKGVDVAEIFDIILKFNNAMYMNMFCVAFSERKCVPEEQPCVMTERRMPEICVFSQGPVRLASSTAALSFIRRAVPHYVTFH